MKRIIATFLAASALLGASQAFAYEQTTITTTRTVETHQAPVIVVRDRDEWRHREWMREQHRRRWMEARRNYEREQAYRGD